MYNFGPTPRSTEPRRHAPHEQNKMVTAHRAPNLSAIKLAYVWHIRTLRHLACENLRHPVSSYKFSGYCC